MHQFLSAVGLGCCDSKTKIDKLIDEIICKEMKAGNYSCVETPLYEEEMILFAQIKHYFNSVCGITIVGTYDVTTDTFTKEYYYPFLDGSVVSHETEVSIGRKIDKMAFNALCDEPGRGIALIFSLTNAVDYLSVTPLKGDFYDKEVYVSAMSNEGTILLPVGKSKEQIDRSKAATAARNNLINRAKKGDTSAIDNLTIDDLDTYTDIYKRMRKEDIFTIVDTSFMPSGFECDSYTVIGNIEQVEKVKNKLTDEEIYVMTLECNDIVFDLCINEKNLTGIPEAGRRFKGRIWLQGHVEFEQKV